MIRPVRPIAAFAALALLASACGATAAAPARNTATATAAPTVAAATPAPTPTEEPKPVVPATGEGAAVVKLTESTLTLPDGSASAQLPAGNYISTVSLVTLEKGGRTLAHKHGGIEAIYVLDGVIDFRTAGGGRVILRAGQGASVAPNTPLQAVNGGDGVARFLAFFLTSEAAPFQTPVDEAP